MAENETKNNEVKDPKQTLNNPKGEEMVQIPKAAWEKITEKIATLEETQDVLREAADKGRLDRIERARSQGKLIKTVHISTLNGKKVVGWRTIKNTLDYDNRGVPHEEQIVEILYADKSKEEMRMVTRARNTVFVKAEVVEESKDQDGRVSYVVQFEDGEKLKIAEIFVN